MAGGCGHDRVEAARGAMLAASSSTMSKGGSSGLPSRPERSKPEGGVDDLAEERHEDGAETFLLRAGEQQ